MKILSYFLLPYPKPTTNKEIISISLLVAVTVYFFIAVFQPFGTYIYQHPYKYLILAPYSIIAFFNFSIVKLIIKKSKFKKWNVGLEIGSIIFILFVSSIFNYTYSIYCINFSNFNWYRFLFMNYCTFTIGVPICLIYFFGTFSVRMKSITDKIDESFDVIIQNGSTELETIGITLSDFQINDISQNFVLAKSDGNYCSVFFLNETNQIVKKIVRISLSNLESQLVSNRIIRCHRSFLINSNFIQSKKGNAQGYKLKLQHIEDLVPVSRNYLSSLIV